MTHASAPGVNPGPAWILGSATLTIDRSSTSMNSAVPRTGRSPRRGAASGVGPSTAIVFRAVLFRAVLTLAVTSRAAAFRAALSRAVAFLAVAGWAEGARAVGRGVTG